jgi:hypothetical protein
VPRNVVTLSPRFDFFGRNREARERLLSALGERYRFRAVENRVEIDFPKRLGREAKAQVVAELDRIDPDWGRLFRLYPLD